MERPLPTPSEDLAPQQWVPPIVPSSPSASSGNAPAPLPVPTLDFLGLFQVIARKKWIVLMMLVAWVGLAILALKVSPRIFEATGELEVESQDPQVRPYETIQKEDLSSIDALKTVERNLQSTTLITRMIEAQGLGEQLDGSLGAQIGQIQANSAVQLVRGTRNVSISYRGTDPEFAARVVNAYIDEFQAMEQEDKKRLEDKCQNASQGP